MKERTQPRRAKLFDELETGEIASYFGVKRRTVEFWIKTNKLPNKTIESVLNFVLSRTQYEKSTDK